MKRLKLQEWQRAVFLIAFTLGVLVMPLILLAQGAPPDGSATPPIEKVPEVLSTQLVVSYIFVWLQQKLKASKFVPFIEEGTTAINVAMAWIFAAAQAVGIGWTFDTSAGTLMITGLSFGAVVEFGRAYIVQKLIYRQVHVPAESVQS